MSRAAREPPATEVRAERRRFTAAYRQRILAEADAATEPGALGALLRREGLYHSTLSKWRAMRDRGGTPALEAQKPGRKPSGKDPAVAKLERENRRLTQKLERAEKIIEIQKKLSEILGIELQPEPPEVDE